MKDNWNICIIGEKVKLIPYCKKHVMKYHEWMKDPWIREMTASEPLSLEEEYEMQQSWYLDDKKCTFIILDNNSNNNNNNNNNTDNNNNNNDNNNNNNNNNNNDNMDKDVNVDNNNVNNIDNINNTIDRDEETMTNNNNNNNNDNEMMIGDVNFFLNDIHERPLDNVELEIMIAEKAYRRQGKAKETIQLMMKYAYLYHHIKRFYVKISSKNINSRTLFTEKLHFQMVNFNKTFDEYEYEYDLSEKRHVYFDGELGKEIDQRILKENQDRMNDIILNVEIYDKH